MGLLVLVLRSYLVFQNIYVTYKTLKLPPPSSRNGGKPTVRAMTQRKRDMKGCMAIWIVWCCLAAYEYAVERLISIFIPFYDEIKSVILALFILARARGAEPIYLHIIRPFLKPYVPMLDGLLDMAHSIGDFVLLVLYAPLSPIFAWWRSRYPALASTDTDSDESSDRSEPPPPYNFPAQPSGRQTGPDNLEASMARFYANGDRPGSNHEFWQPAPSAYSEYHQEASMSMPRPSIPSFASPDDSWRAYPPFPSAYPPTPLRANRTSVPAMPAQYLESDLPDFRPSLLPPRELSNPSSDGGLSDEIQTSGVQVQDHVPLNRLDNVNDHDNDLHMSSYAVEEDSFDITLRTPYLVRSQPAVVYPSSITREQSNASAAATVASSASSDIAETSSVFTGLSTVRHASTLRTTTSVESSAYTSSDASLVHRKRRISDAALDPPSALDSDPPNPIRTPRRRANRTPPSGVKRNPLKVAVSRTHRNREVAKSAGTSSGGTDSSSVAPKRRRVVNTSNEQSSATELKPPRRAPRKGASGQNADASGPRPGSSSRSPSRISVRSTGTKSTRLPRSVHVPRNAGPITHRGVERGTANVPDR